MQKYSTTSVVRVKGFLESQFILALYVLLLSPDLRPWNSCYSCPHTPVQPLCRADQHHVDDVRFRFLVTAKKVKDHSCRISLSVPALTPGGGGRTPSGVVVKLPVRLLYVQLHTSPCNCAELASMLSHRVLYASKTLL